MIIREITRSRSIIVDCFGFCLAPISLPFTLLATVALSDQSPHDSNILKMTSQYRYMEIRLSGSLLQRSMDHVISKLIPIYITSYDVVERLLCFLTNSPMFNSSLNKHPQDIVVIPEAGVVVLTSPHHLQPSTTRQTGPLQ